MDPPPERERDQSSTSNTGFKRIAPERSDDSKRRAVQNDKTPADGRSRASRPAQRGSAFFEPETDTKRLLQRQKQIDYGKNTVGYQRYTEAVPRSARRRGDPMTPDKFKRMAKRTWDYEVSKWRRALHKWDPAGTPAPQGEGVVENDGAEEPEALPVEEIPADEFPEELPQDLADVEPVKPPAAVNGV